MGVLDFDECQTMGTCYFRVVVDWKLEITTFQIDNLIAIFNCLVGRDPVYKI